MYNIKKQDLAVLYNNQMQHFKSLDQSVNVDFLKKDTFKAIEDVFSSIEFFNLFDFKTIRSDDDMFKYLEVVRQEETSVESNYENDFMTPGEVEIKFKCKKFENKFHKVFTLNDINSGFELMKLMNEPDSKIFEFIEPYYEAYFINHFLSSLQITSNDIVVVDVNYHRNTIRSKFEFLNDEDFYFLFPRLSFVRSSVVMQAIEQCADIMFNELFRGGANNIVCSKDVASYLKLFHSWKESNNKISTGLYFAGSFNEINVYVSRSIPSGDAYVVWSNKDNEIDLTNLYGIKVPFAYEKESDSIGFIGDIETLQPKYIKKLQFVGLDKI